MGLPGLRALGEEAAQPPLVAEPQDEADHRLRGALRDPGHLPPGVLLGREELHEEEGEARGRSLRAGGAAPPAPGSAPLQPLARARELRPSPPQCSAGGGGGARRAPLPGAPPGSGSSFYISKNFSYLFPSNFFPTGLCLHWLRCPLSRPPAPGLGGRGPGERGVKWGAAAPGGSAGGSGARAPHRATASEAISSASSPSSSTLGSTQRP